MRSCAQFSQRSTCPPSAAVRGGEAVPQGVRRDALGDPCRLRRGVDGAHELTGRHRVDRVLAGEEPSLRPRRLPPFAQQLEQLRGEHHVAVPLPLALLDPKRHALAVDIGHLEVRDLGHPQACAVGDAERGFVLEAGRGFEETRHFLLAQHHRRLARPLHRRQMPDEVGPFERDLEEEPQRRARRVDAPRADLMLGEMQLISTKVLARGGIRRTAEKGREVPHVPDVVPLGVFGEPTRRHIVDHALAQRADGFVCHRKSSCLAWGLNPTILRQARALASAMDLRLLTLPLAAPTARLLSANSGH